jgi:hypothetical protein
MSNERHSVSHLLQVPFTNVIVQGELNQSLFIIRSGTPLLNSARRSDMPASTACHTSHLHLAA